jgi:hypothetical protein
LLPASQGRPNRSFFVQGLQYSHHGSGVAGPAVVAGAFVVVGAFVVDASGVPPPFGALVVVGGSVVAGALVVVGGSVVAGALVVVGGSVVDASGVPPPPLGGAAVVGGVHLLPNLSFFVTGLHGDAGGV